MCLHMRFLNSLLLSGALSCGWLFAPSAHAQDQSIDELMEQIPDLEMLPDLDAPKAEPVPQTDYSMFTEEEERTAKLDALFIRLAAEEDADTAGLIAEEVMAIWIDSGSETVNLLLRRATSAEERGAIGLSRRLYDHVTTLSPDYAEGWARSGRLALIEKDYNRAITELTTAMVLEPRHFYALLTFGAALEGLGRSEQAYEAYKEVAALYPKLKGIEGRVKSLGDKIDGDFL